MHDDVSYVIVVVWLFDTAVLKRNVLDFARSAVDIVIDMNSEAVEQTEVERTQMVYLIHGLLTVVDYHIRNLLT
jgi:hypothetical protein